MNETICQLTAYFISSDNIVQNGHGNKYMPIFVGRHLSRGFKLALADTTENVKTQSMTLVLYSITKALCKQIIHRQYVN